MSLVNEMLLQYFTVIFKRRGSNDKVLYSRRHFKDWKDTRPFEYGTRNDGDKVYVVRKDRKYHYRHHNRLGMDLRFGPDRTTTGRIGERKPDGTKTT